MGTPVLVRVLRDDAADASEFERSMIPSWSGRRSALYRALDDREVSSLTG